MHVLERPWGAMHIQASGSADGPAVVFANSLGSDLRLWDAVLPMLPEGHRFIRYDKRGHGLSDLGGPAVLADYAADVVTLIEAQARGPVILVGLSIGGLIAQAVAATRPDLTRALVLSNTAAKLGTAESWQERINAVENGGLDAIADGVLERWFTARFRATPALNLWRNMLIRTPVSGYTDACAALAQADQTEVTRTLRLPTLVIAGAEDGASPPDLVRATADLIPGAAFHLISGAGHLPCVETPSAYADILGPFLEAHS